MATRYWVGGTGTWTSTATTNWSATSGGAGGASAPTVADDVIIDASSGTGTCTTDATAVARTITLDSQTCGLTLGADLTTGAAIAAASSYNFILSGGVFNLNNFTLNSPRTSFSQATNTRSIAFGTSGKIVSNYGDNTYLVFNFSNATNFSYTGTSRIEFTYAGANNITTSIPRTTTGGALATALNYYFTAAIGTIRLDASTAAVVANTVDFTGCTGTLANTALTVYGNLKYASGMTLTAGTLVTTFAATSGIQQITTNGKTLDFPLTQSGVGGTVQLQDNLTMGSTRTFTLTNGALDLNNLTLSTGFFSSGNTNVRSIAFGTGNITLTGSGTTIWVTSNLTNFSYTGTFTVNCTYAGATGTRTITTATGGNGLTEANAPSFNITAGTDTVTIGNCKSIDFTGFSGTFTNTAKTLYGSLTISSGMTCTAGANAVIFSSSSAQTITTNGVTLDFPLTFNNVSGTFAFQDAFTQGATRAFTITNGTVKLKAGATSTVGAFATSGTVRKYLQSTLAGSQATLAQASGTVNASYLTIQDINATGGAEWNAFVNQANIDAGNVDGWNFGISPVVGGAEYTYSLRSFTQPRRF